MPAYCSRTVQAVVVGVEVLRRETDVMKMRNWVCGRFALLGSLCWLVGACSDDEKSDTANLPHFHDLTSAPAAIQTAAKAVVRLHTARSYGTGAYISSTGLLLTNNHVLGEPVCPLEGCYVEVSTLHQRGQAKLDDETYFAVPTAVDLGLDMAVVQLFDPTTKEKVATPNSLQFEPKEAEALVEQHVTVVGHPEGNLKKWTNGVVVSSSGKWFTASTYILPGDSGSPVLSDAGKVVGLIHRGPASLDLVTEQGINVYAIGTASAPIHAALQAPLPTTLISLASPTTAEEFVKNDEVYLNARATSVTIGGVSVPVMDVLGRACDAALGNKDFLSLDEQEDILAPCLQARTWIECRTDAAAVAYATVCPAEVERQTWRARFKSVNQAQIDMNGSVDFYTIGPAMARLEDDLATGKVAGANSLQQVLDANSPALNFELAYYLAMFNINSYDGASVSRYVTAYSEQPYYELDAEYIAYGASWLTSNKNITPTQLVDLLNRLMGDPKVSIGAKLAIEDFMYEIGAL